MTIKLNYPILIDQLIREGRLELPMAHAPRRHVWKIMNECTKRGYDKPQARWSRDDNTVIFYFPERSSEGRRSGLFKMWG